MRSNTVVTLARVCLSLLLMVIVANARIHKLDIRVGFALEMRFFHTTFIIIIIIIIAHLIAIQEKKALKQLRSLNRFDGSEIVSYNGIILWEKDAYNSALCVHYDRTQESLRKK